MAVLFLGSLFALESDPSDVVGYIKYPCVTTATTNLNFVTNSMDAGYVMASDLGNAITGCDVVNYWDAASQGWAGATYIGFWLGDFALNAGWPYMVNVTAGTDFYSAGGLYDPVPTFTLVTTATTDLNAISLKLSRSDLTMAGAVGDDIGVCDVVNYWDAPSQGWAGATYIGFWLGDFAVAIGDPLMVNVTSGTVWGSTTVPIAKKNNTVQLNK